MPICVDMFKKYFVFAILLVYSKTVDSQDITDTLFYDNKWAICEKPIADYYRIATLRVKDRAFFVGEIKDYYLNGQLEMKGVYNEKGVPDGEFSWYYEDGKLAKQGKFENNVMKGPWSFYDHTGKLSMLLTCFDEKDFQPVIICDRNGDTVFKENGNFRIIVKNYPQVFSSKDYILEGEIKDGLKSGSWKYCLEMPSFPKEDLDKRDVIFEEVYKNGQLKRTIGHGGLSNSGNTFNQSAKVIHLHPIKLTATESLTTDFIFLDDDQQKYKLGNLLINKILPVRNMEPISTRSNFAGYIFCISSALKKRAYIPGSVNYLPGKEYIGHTFNLTTAIQNAGDSISVPDIKAMITFVVSSAGTVENIKIDGNLDDRTNKAIAYYLSRLRHLFVCTDTAKRQDTLQIRREWLTQGSGEQEKAVSTLILEEKLSEEELQQLERLKSWDDKDIVFTKVEIEPVYIGGESAWRRYLNNHLRYPAEAMDKKIQGNVVIQFIVDKEGKVSDVKPVSGDPLLLEEGIRLIKESGKWMSGIQNGHRVKAYKLQTINFRID